jgi:hypothetical protein
MGWFLFQYKQKDLLTLKYLFILETDIRLHLKQIQILGFLLQHIIQHIQTLLIPPFKQTHLNGQNLLPIALKYFGKHLGQKVVEVVVLEVLGKGGPHLLGL